MKVIVTGATGFVGRQLVPLLIKAGAEVLLVGRQVQATLSMFPGASVCIYDEIEFRGAGFDLLVHLAVVNNDSRATRDEFDRVNIDLLMSTVAKAKHAGVPRFVNISSIHALDVRNTSPYAISKREGVRRLASIDGIDATTVYLPAVYGAKWAGRLGFLNAFPRLVARPLFVVLSALLPTLHVARIAEFLLSGASAAGDQETILTDGQHENVVYRTLKRALDLGFAVSVTLLFWWGMVLMWIVVKSESRGPGVFSQKRVGKHGLEFVCHKFRTMREGTAHVGTDKVSPAAVTRFGRLLRRTKLDELPQIINIFRNEMSLIGPRPCLPTQTELIEARKRRGVLQLKPGISGLAQVNGIDMSDPEKLSLWDARYLALQCLSLDLRIILATVVGRGSGDRVKPS